MTQGGKENSGDNMALKGLTGCIRILLHNVKTKGVICANITKRSDCWTCRVGAKRHILSENVIKLQEFQEKKLAVAHQIYGGKEEYFQKLNQKLQKKELILKDELKLLLHLCETPDDVDTARSAIYRYHEENFNVAFGEFKFGPLFMRLCYELGMEEIAANTIKDKTLRGFFSDSTSFNLAMDMLFMKGYYDSALEVLITMRDLGVPFNTETVTVAFAICYKLNTPRSYKICTALLEEAQIKGQRVHRQAYCFLVALALKQNDLARAESVYTQIMNPENQICQNLKVLILAQSGAMNDVLSILASALMPNSSPFVKKPEFSHEVVDALRAQAAEKAPLRERVERALARLQQNGQVTALGLDAMLCHTPNRRRRPAGLLQERGRSSSRRTFRPLQSTLLLE
ncbi:pentatricopeptide repeat-containing protein 2, mitochondrial [Anguilla anguilla]|uniref:pentatricopeptide repeat-containing protein 2, mitochondrial n=1 Tax=Anguilla anguilla TaxID=7936 RepID=UPI0015AA1DAB|nr:pentatricopeptide repeat-containing protein 2, mitochondrial [Anguilla anguilla]